MAALPLSDTFFRREYGGLVATLVRRVGAQHLQLVEDAAQAALLAALEQWPRAESPPTSPSAWLYRVAHRKLLDELRMRSRRARLLEAAPPPEPTAAPSAALGAEIADDVLRMLFVCCDAELPATTQLVLALRTLGGFSVREIAARLFITEANVYKRLGRARARLREAPPRLDGPMDAEPRERRAAVQHVLYLMFTEGHLSSHAELAVRRELCDEAIRLTRGLVDHPIGDTPEAHALLALMYLHAARMASREDAGGALLLLEEQDRDTWDPRAIATGMEWLQRSARGPTVSRYHLEARIAAAHALAPSFAKTRWDDIAESYRQLEQLAPSPLHRLGRALAVAEHEAPDAGLALLDGHVPPSWLAGSFQWSAVLADLHRRCGHDADARQHLDRALRAAPSDAVRALLRRRFGHDERAATD